jgi:ATP-dependent Clp protease protease subunit
MNKFWRFTNISNEGGGTRQELELFGEIADEKWFDDEITPEMFRAELAKCSGDITVWINSPGGDCVSASVIYTMLLDYSGKITVKISGLAASAASVVAMAGDVVQMAPTALMMIHNPAIGAWGDHNTMKKAIDILNEVKESIINAYERKTGLSRARLSHLIENETWMNANRALDLGFIDSVMGYDNDNVKAYTYDAATVAASFSNKHTEKAEKPASSGAKVSDLMASLYEKAAPPQHSTGGAKVSDLMASLYERKLRF